MNSSTDLLLGAFLIVSGLILSFINLRRLVTQKTQFQTVLLSENVLLLCIGIAFVIRSVYNFNPMNIKMNDIEEQSGVVRNITKHQEMDCNFMAVLLSYGPLIVSLVNSFLSLVIDNYMHYTMLEDAKKADEENIVQEIGQRSHNFTKKTGSSFISLIKSYFLVIAGLSQWIIPIGLALSMYPLGVKEKAIFAKELRNLGDSCMTMLEITNRTCSIGDNNLTLELRNYVPAENYFEVYEKTNNSSLQNKSAEIRSVIDKIYSIVNGFEKNMDTKLLNATSIRKNKATNNNCWKMCYVETNSLLLYMFLLAVVSYFVPITISTVILTKMHVMNVTKPSTKTYVSRELLYNMLFWTPVMFETFVSLLFCSYAMNGTRTSIFNVVANIYQVVKNFMNTKYFRDNSVAPI